VPRVYDRVRVVTATTGTGTLTLGAADSGFRTFADAAVPNGTVVHYAIEDGTAWEIGTGTYSTTGPTLTRTLISSSTGALLNLSGSARVMISANAGHFNDIDLSTVLLEEKASVQTAPVAGLLLYARNRAGRRILDIIGPSGIDVALQPALFANTVSMWLPGTGTTLAINFGVAWTARNVGTGAVQAHPTLASTNILTQMKRATFTTAAGATNSSGIQSTSELAWRGNATGLGGFFFYARVGIEAMDANGHFMVGLSALNAALAGNPSAQNNTVCFGCDAADTNLQLITRDAAAATKTDLGVGKVAAVNSVFDVYFFAIPNGSQITARVVNVGTGAVLANNVALTANLPVATTFLFAHAQIRSVTTTTAKTLALNRIYVETDT